MGHYCDVTDTDGYNGKKVFNYYGDRFMHGRIVCERCDAEVVFSGEDFLYLAKHFSCPVCGAGTDDSHFDIQVSGFEGILPYLKDDLDK